MKGLFHARDSVLQCVSMKPKRKVLSNGLRIITVPMKGSETVAVYVLADTGTEYERKEENGISHFLEHVCFKGTPTRPTALAITKEFDGIGAYVNAFTAYEYTGYHAYAHKKHLSHVVEVLSDLYLNALFPPEEVEKEKGVILEEINMYEDLPKSKAAELYRKLLYGDQPAGWSILGRKEVVSSLKPADFRTYRNKHYVASATTVVVAGDVKESEAVSLVKKTFKDIPTGKKQGKKKTVERQNAPAVLMLPKKIDQTHIVLGVRTFPVLDKRSVTLSLLNTILGRGMSSRLSQVLREELGICYYIRSGVDESLDHGSLAVVSGVDTRRVIPAVKAILGEFTKLKRELVSPEELQKAKEYSVGSMYLSLETADARAGHYAALELMGEPLISPEEAEKKIRSVSAEDIRKLAREIFIDKRLNFTAVGKVPKEAEIRAVLQCGA